MSAAKNLHKFPSLNVSENACAAQALFGGGFLSPGGAAGIRVEDLNKHARPAGGSGDFLRGPSSVYLLVHPGVPGGTLFPGKAEVCSGNAGKFNLTLEKTRKINSGTAFEEIKRGSEKQAREIQINRNKKEDGI